MARPMVRQWTWLPYVMVFLAIAALWGPAIVTGRVPAFRDAAHYYYPLYRLVHASWSRGEVPLWNPYEDTGRPLLADMTSGALYPGHLLFALPTEYPTNFAIFLASHLVLAGAGVAYAAQRWRWSWGPACVAATSYALGGSVYGQYANPPFLISAAWLPWLCVELERAIRAGRPTAACRAAIPWTLMLLGGDLQTAYHVGLLASLFLAGPMLGRVCTALVNHRGYPVVPRTLQRLRPTVALATTATLTLGLSAAQIVPSWEFAQHSDRADTDAPRNIYEWWASSPREVKALVALARRPEAGTHEAKVNRFSVGPWRWLELFWPSCFGQVYPVNTRWLSAWPAEGSFWVPSLYMGLLPAVWMWGSLRWVRGSKRRRWLSWMLAFSVTAALGGYGVAWLINQGALILGRDLALPQTDPSVGGLYWWCRILLPSYANFRYPAKWWTFTQLALSLLAGQALQDFCSSCDAARKQPLPQSTQRRWPFPGESSAAFGYLQPLLATLIVVSLVVICSTYVCGPSWTQLLSRAQVDTIWGPLDVSRTLPELRHHMLHTALYGVLLSQIVRRYRLGYPGPHASSSNGHLGSANHPATKGIGWPAFLQARSLAVPTAMSLFAVAHALELTYAQSSILLTVPHQVFAADDAFANIPAAQDAVTPVGSPLPHRPPLIRYFRLGRAEPYPGDWSWQGNAQRTAQLVRRDVLTGYPKYHLLIPSQRLASVAGPVSVRPATIERWLRTAELLQAQELPLSDQQWQALQALSVQYVVDPRDESAVAQPVPDALPRAWLERLADPTALAEQSPVSLSLSNDPARVRMDVDAPERQVFQVQLDAPGRLVINDLAYPGWTATVTTDERERRVPVQTVRSIQRQIELPAGDHRVTLEYRPKSWQVGCSISIIFAGAWIAIVCYWRASQHGIT